MRFLLVRARVPGSVCRYIVDFYSRLRTRVSTEQWETDAMPVRVGTVQGDTLSPILFNLVINPIIEYLKTELKHGYLLKNNQTGAATPFIT